MKILVIGNGFDRQHGLSTNYGDFLDFCKAVTNVRAGGKIEITRDDIERAGILNSKDVLLAEEFYKLMNSFWIKLFLDREAILKPNWINFETEIENTVKNILNEYNRTSSNGEYEKIEIPAPYNRFVSAPVSEIKDLFDYLRDELAKLSRALEIYLDTVVDKELENSEAKIPAIVELKPDKLLSFNYTRTYFERYDSSVEYDYIHGKADIRKGNKDCNLIIGFDDYYQGKIPTLELVPFEKYYQRIVHKTGAKYTKWLEDKNINREIYFYGHSMTPADGDILKQLIGAPNTKTFIYYRKDYEKDRAEMIQNLAVVLTPAELIKITGGDEPSLQFVPI